MIRWDGDSHFDGMNDDAGPLIVIEACIRVLSITSDWRHNAEVFYVSS